MSQASDVDVINRDGEQSRLWVSERGSVPSVKPNERTNEKSPIVSVARNNTDTQLAARPYPSLEYTLIGLVYLCMMCVCVCVG